LGDIFKNSSGTDVMTFKIFSSKKQGVFDSKQSKIMQKFDPNIIFCEKRHFFRRKLSKIAEN
jgi:hypothetical protein